MPTSAQTILTRYAHDVAFVAEEAPATTLTEFVDQLDTAGSRMEDAGINNAEDLATAALYLNEAVSLTGDDSSVLIKRASGLLSDVPDMVDEYRDMV